MVHLLKGRVTHVALEWSLRVHSEMSRHIMLMFEGLVTYVALKWLFILVHSKMPS